MNKKIDEWQKTSNKLSSSTDDEAVIKAQASVNICQKTWESYSEIINSIVDSERENIAKQMSDTFTQHLTNNPELYTGLELDEEYHLLVKQLGYDPIPAWKMEPSSGMSAMIAFSFIRALNAHSQTSAPIVIDTPTGRLDPVHSDNIINYWKNFGEQVFILYQPNEINNKQPLDFSNIGRKVLAVCRADSKLLFHVFCHCSSSGKAADTLRPSPTFTITISKSLHLSSTSLFKLLSDSILVQSHLQAKTLSKP